MRQWREMPKTGTFQDLSFSPAEKGQKLWRWIYSEMRSGIAEGRLPAGSRLPSSRSLASQYGLSRGTVVLAFDQLRAEGFIAPQTSSGTYVANGFFETRASADGRRRQAKKFSKPGLAIRAQDELTASDRLPAMPGIGKAFRGYEPALDLFPVDLWSRVASRVYRRADRSLYGRGCAAGYLPLRRAISEYVGASRGVRCCPEQIVITSGTQQALDLIGRILLNPGDGAWMEDPGYAGAWQALRSAGAVIAAVPVDKDGIDVKAGKRLAPTAKIAYVTPANQFPLGVTMSAERRMELLKWARESGAWIVEDEYDAEHRFSGRPVASLQSLDTSDSVIYTGTFTKMLFNALRLGFVVLPWPLIEPFQMFRRFVDVHPPTLDEAILAEFMTEGHFGHHVRKMRQTYAERMDVLKKVCDKYVRGLIKVDRANAGMRTLGWLQTGVADTVAAQRAMALHLEVAPLSAFCFNNKLPAALVLGFASCSAAELRRGAVKLARALTKTTA